MAGQKQRGNAAWIGAAGEVLEWALTEDRRVPAIEICEISVVLFPVADCLHFNYGPELMGLRRERVKELGWSSTTFDLPLAPRVVGRYSLLSDALLKVRSALGSSGVVGGMEWPSTFVFTRAAYGCRVDYYRLYFGRAAYEFYDLLFRMARGRPDVVFDNLPSLRLNTLPQILRWAKGFQYRRRRLYKKNGFTWDPMSDDSAQDAASS